MTTTEGANTNSANSSATTSTYNAGSQVSGTESGSSKVSDSKMMPVSAADLNTVYYFDFDSSSIQAGSIADLDQLATYLKKDRAHSVVLGGHADERGTREYNMALGERRAKSVENYLLLQGAYRSQLEAVSYGEEKPAMAGQGNASMAKNRRVEAKL
ncbi:MAG: OmpA family protein [Pseudomonadales bacterium]|nr:OmpA family protein [Pseudomonadales bacterium]